jgi:hypothetical protein
MIVVIVCGLALLGGVACGAKETAEAAHGAISDKARLPAGEAPAT